jgi:hypothetical protein
VDDQQLPVSSIGSSLSSSVMHGDHAGGPRAAADEDDVVGLDRNLGTVTTAAEAAASAADRAMRR